MEPFGRASGQALAPARGGQATQTKRRPERVLSTSSGLKFEGKRKGPRKTSALSSLTRPAGERGTRGRRPARCFARRNKKGVPRTERPFRLNDSLSPPSPRPACPPRPACGKQASEGKKPPPTLKLWRGALQKAELATPKENARGGMPRALNSLPS